MSTHACGGKCCEDFTLNLQPEKFGRIYQNILAKRNAGELLNDNQRDHLYIGDMVVRIDEDDEERPRYTCRNFDPASGRCTSCDDRPAMCRDYPDYGRPSAPPCFACGFKGDCQSAPPAEDSKTVSQGHS